MRAKHPVSIVIVCVLVDLCLHRGDARAEQPVREAMVTEPFSDGVWGPVVDAGIGTSAVGDTLMFEIGIEGAGLRNLRDRHWLLQWDAVMAGRGGYLANRHPYLFLIGGREMAWAEAGYRFSDSTCWSSYLGGRLGQDARILVHPGLALSALDTVNNVDRVGGAAASGVIRVDFGASFLDTQRSLLLVAFVQEAFQTREINTDSQRFTGAGIAARLDIARNITATMEVGRGVTPTRRDVLRGLTDQTTRTGGSATFRKVFRNRMWVSAAVSLERDTDHVIYTDSGATYDTGNARVFGFTILYGLPVFSWRKR